MQDTLETPIQRKSPAKVQSQTQTQTPAQSKPPALPDPIKDEEWAKALLDVVKHFDIADKFVRDNQVRKWRKQMCYWDGLQFLWWSDVIHDWRTPDQISQDFTGTDADVDIDPTLYAKVINIYRAHGEVIIAAMSSSTPKVQFPPEDADNPDDVLCAKAYTKLAKLIERHNYAELLLIKALFILYNQGLVCAYNESYEDEEYGQVKKPIETPTIKTNRNYYCPNCAAPLGQEELPQDPSQQEGMTDEVNTSTQGGSSEEQGMDQSRDSVASPSDQNVLPANISQQQQAPPAQMAQPQQQQPPMQQPIQDTICPQCSNEAGGMEVRVQPEFEDVDEIGSEVTGWDVQNKCRELLSIWGPLNVKVPAWIRRLQDSPYLILETEEHYAKMQDIYQEIAEDIAPSYSLERFDRAMRTPTSYAGDTPRDLVTVRRCWLRPWAFNVLGNTKDESEIAETIQELKGKFPNGCYVVLIGDDLVAEAVPDKMDDHWTLTNHPLSDTIHAEPMGAPMMPMQEMTNELGNLTLENIEHSIPETFADSDTLDFPSYDKSEARPGMVYPVSKRPGEALGNSFYEITGGQLSREVELFGNRLEKFAQFVVGSLPSVFGGQIQGGSDTAKEYELSRAAALQRLSTTWRLVTIWWTQTLGKAVKSYASDLLAKDGGDEHYTQSQGGDNYINVWIRIAHLRGKTGLAYSEASESLPVTWNEKRSIIMNMLTMNNQQIMEVLADPENASFVARTIGVSELYIPGDNDRTKQLMEIAQMIQEQPHEMPSMDGQVETMSSVQVDPELDNHHNEAEICANWLKSEIGQDAKRNNPAAYMNVLAHFKEHKAAEQAQMAPPPQPGQPGQGQPPHGQQQPQQGNDVQEIGAHA